MGTVKTRVEEWECFECDEEVKVTIRSSTDPEAPDIFSVPGGCSITCISLEDEDSGQSEDEFVVFCSEECATDHLASYNTSIDATGEEVH